MEKKPTANGAARPAKVFKQVSLPIDFLAKLESTAINSGRSVAKQIEHCVLIASAIENTLPGNVVNELKTGENPKLITERLIRFYDGLNEPSTEFSDAWNRSVKRIRAERETSATTSEAPEPDTHVPATTGGTNASETPPRARKRKKLEVSTD